MELMKRLWNDDAGQGMVEYGLIIAVVALIVVGGLTVFGGRLLDFFNTLGEDAL